MRPVKVECGELSSDEAFLAQLGVECCNNLAEQRLSAKDARMALAFCRTAEILCARVAEGPELCKLDISWAASCFTLLFTEAEAVRRQGQVAVLSSDKQSRCFLKESLQCLLECEKMLARMPGCSANPENVYTCLAETQWRLKDLEGAQTNCHKGLSILSQRDGASNIYATTFLLWILQNVSVERNCWWEARASLECAKSLAQRSDDSSHRKLVRRMERLGRKLPQAYEEPSVRHSLVTKSDLVSIIGRAVKSSEDPMPTWPVEEAKSALQTATEIGVQTATDIGVQTIIGEHEQDSDIDCDATIEEFLDACGRKHNSHSVTDSKLNRVLQGILSAASEAGIDVQRSQVAGVRRQHPQGGDGEDSPEITAFLASLTSAAVPSNRSPDCQSSSLAANCFLNVQPWSTVRGHEQESPFFAAAGSVTSHRSPRPPVAHDNDFHSFADVTVPVPRRDRKQSVSQSVSGLSTRLPSTASLHFGVVDDTGEAKSHGLVEYSVISDAAKDVANCAVDAVAGAPDSENVSVVGADGSSDLHLSRDLCLSDTQLSVFHWEPYASVHADASGSCVNPAESESLEISASQDLADAGFNSHLWNGSFLELRHEPDCSDTVLARSRVEQETAPGRARAVLEKVLAHDSKHRAEQEQQTCDCPGAHDHNIGECERLGSEPSMYYNAAANYFSGTLGVEYFAGRPAELHHVAPTTVAEAISKYSPDTSESDFPVHEPSSSVIDAIMKHSAATSEADHPPRKPCDHHSAPTTVAEAIMACSSDTSYMDIRAYQPHKHHAAPTTVDKVIMEYSSGTSAVALNVIS